MSEPGAAHTGDTLQLATLQDLTARLARIISSTEVAAFVLDEGIARLGATSGSLCLVVDGELEITASAGYPADVVEAFGRFPMDTTTPAGECALTRLPIYVESLEDLYGRYPIFHDGPIVGDPATAVLPLEASDATVLGTIVVGFGAPQEFRAVDRQLLEAIAREAAVALERARANEALVLARMNAEEARDQLAFLAEASKSLAASLDLDETLAKVADLAVPRIADRCTLHLLEDGSEIRKIVLAPTLDAAEQALFEWRKPTLDDPSGIGLVIRTGEPVFLPEVSDVLLDSEAPSPEYKNLLRRAGIGGTFLMPLTVRGEQIGALTFVNRRGRAFRMTERVLGEELAVRAAVAIDNARLFSREVNIADTLQHALLPDVPKMGAIEAAARYLPGVAGVEVGGDWYDIFCLAENRYAFVVGDVSGRGLRAATTMASLRYSTKAYLVQGDPPESVLHKLNGLHSFEREHQFATILIGEIDVPTRRLTLASAGHLPPLLMAEDGARFLEVPVSTPVGVSGGRQPAAISVDLPVGSTLVAFTDGLVERSGEHLDRSLERLRVEAEALRPEAAVQETVDQLITNLIPGGATDDIVILGLRWRS